MRRSAATIALGGVLLIAAAAGFIVVPEHKPAVAGGQDLGPYLLGGQSYGFSRTLYDTLRVTTWALLIVGALLVAVGLINYARRPYASGTASDTALRRTTTSETAR